MELSSIIVYNRIKVKKLLFALVLIASTINYVQAQNCSPPFSYRADLQKCCYVNRCIDPEVIDVTGEDVVVSLYDKLILKDGRPVKEVFNSTDDMINLIVRVLFVAAGLVLFFIIIAAGFALIKGESKDKDQAKTQMTGAIIGFIIMFAAYWIMQIVQLMTGISMGF